MRIAFLGDIHGNFDALQAVLSAIDEEGVDSIYSVGDAVGYGAEPGECIAEIRRRKIPAVAGNHDYGVARRLSLEYFNAEARGSVRWTQSALNDDETQFLAALPLVVEGETFCVVHGSVAHPESFDYVLAVGDAAASFEELGKTCGFIGHSHMPAAFLRSDEGISVVSETEFTVPPDDKALVNVGSVGQPRDGNPDAAYAIYDAESGKVAFRRVRYDIDEAARKILAAGLPALNAYRLYLGR